MEKPHHTDKRHAPLGDPPKYFCEARAEIWEEVKELCPLELKRADTQLISMLVKRIFNERQSEKSLVASDAKFLVSLLEEFNMTPKSRGQGVTKKMPGGAKKEPQPDETQKTPFTKFKGPPRPQKR